MAMLVEKRFKSKDCFFLHNLQKAAMQKRMQKDQALTHSS